MEDISRRLGIDCDYRRLPAYRVSRFEHSDPRHEKDRSEIKKEVEAAQKLGLDASYRDGLAVQGWDGKPDQRDGAIFSHQATFHPAKDLLGVLEWLRRQPNFQCFARTKMMSVKEYDIVKIQTVDEHTITVKTVWRRPVLHYKE